MLKKYVAAAAVIGALGFIAGPAFAETACVHAHVQVNDTVQDVDQCV